MSSVYYTPPVLAIGLCSLVLDDLMQRGGVAWADEQCRCRSSQMYELLDASNGFYTVPAPRALRSRVAIVFRLKDANLGPLFHKEAAKRQLYQLENHPSVGGLRACLYNSVEDEAFACLMQFLYDFKKQYGAQ